MAILFMDGFDLYNGSGAGIGLQSKWIAPSSFVVLGPGRFGGQAVVPNGGGSAGSSTMDRGHAEVSSLSIGFAYRADAILSRIILAFQNGTTTSHISLHLVNNGALEIRNAGNTIVGTTAAGVIALDAWHYIEFGATISDTAGTAELKLDGVTLLSLTGLDTRNGTTTTANLLRLHTSVTGAGRNDFDDLYLCDTFASLGQRRIDVIRPSADTIDKDFVPSTGTVNYAMVDDALAETTDYVQGSVVGDLDLYDLGNLSVIPTTIDAVQVNVWALKTDTVARSIAAVADNAGTQTQSPNHALTSSVTKMELLMPNAPGGAAWTAALVNGLKIGPKVTV